MAQQFSECGSYFAHLTTDGKLKIWNTLTNTFEQEFIPDFHLTTPCACLQFVTGEESSKNGTPSPKKKKRKGSISQIVPNIVVGTTSGLLLYYSISKANVSFTVDSGTNQPIQCLSGNNSTIYSGSEQDILEWNLKSRSFKSKWKAGNEMITSVLLVPHTDSLITASKTIKVWDVKTKEVLRQFTGHSSDITHLSLINSSANECSYLLSASKSDRLLSCWNLSGNSRQKNAVANFAMEDVIKSISVNVTDDGSTKIAACVRSGVIHLYYQKLNGKCDKPLKPKTTIQVVSDTGQQNNGEMVMPIKIFGAVFKEENSICIGYGTEIVLTFENIDIKAYKKFECLIRKHPKSSESISQEHVQKNKLTLANSNVHYLTPHTSSVSNETIKRKKDGLMEVPMEKRLENLSITHQDGSGSFVAQINNVAHLLVQGLHSKDKKLLFAALSKNDENVIRNTVKRLPYTAFVPLVNELTDMLKGKTYATQMASLWLKHLSQVHAGTLISNPELPELFGQALSNIEARVSMQMRLRKLKGKLDLVMPPLTNSRENDCGTDDALLFFNDKDSSDSDQEDQLKMDSNENSDEENEWDETSENEDDNMENNHESDSDSVLMLSD